MRFWWCCSVVVVSHALCVAQSAQKPENPNSQKSVSSAKDTAAAQQKPQRVHANLQGFELSPHPTNAGTQVGGASRGLGTATILLAPHKGKAFMLHPLLQWANSNENIKSYELKVFASDGSTVIFQASVSGASLKYPSDAPALQPGKSYFWTVQPSVTMLGEAAEPAEIQMVGSPQREETQSQLANTQEGSIHSAEIYINNRLWYDAIEALTDLLKRRPNDAELLRRRAEIYEQLPQTRQAAEADLRAADKSAQEEDH